MPIHSPSSHLDKEHTLLSDWSLLAKKAADKVALHFHISQLLPYNRQPQQIQQAFNDLVRVFSPLNGKAYYLKNDDFVYVLTHSSPILVERFITQFKRSLNSDPLIANNFKRETFYTLYHLGSELRKFEEAVLTIENFSPLRSSQAISDDFGIKIPLMLEGLKLDTLSVIEKALHQADISTFLRRQSLAWCEKDQEPKVMATQFYFSTTAIQEALKLNTSIDGNVWLFQQFTTYLDKHMMTKIPELLSQKSFNHLRFNINLRTVITPYFQSFVKSYDRVKPLTFQFNILDVIAHPDVMDQCYSALNDKNISVCIGGLKANHLDYLVFDNIKANSYKIHWSTALPERVAIVKSLIEKVGPERVILHESGSDNALDFGIEAGIRLYQGQFIDALLNKKA